MRKAIFILALLLSSITSTVFAEETNISERLLTPQLESTSLLLQKIDAGMSLDNFSTEWIENEIGYKDLLNNEKLNNSSDYEYIKKHVTKTIDLFHTFTRLWKSSSQEGYKFTDSNYGLNCTYEKLGDHIVCRISELKSLALSAIGKEIQIMRDGLRDGW
jgi:hypothetical protein